MLPDKMSPFAMVNGRYHVVCNFTLDYQQPTSHELLASLLERHPPETLLLLRRLSDDEEREVCQAVDDAEVDASKEHGQVSSEAVPHTVPAPLGHPYKRADCTRRDGHQSETVLDCVSCRKSARASRLHG